MICITVSVNYDDILDIILPQNYKFFKKWYIVTQSDDQKTIDVINKYNFENVEILYFNFKENASFNKGGGIRYAQLTIGDDYDGDLLLLDSDIFLADEFMDYVELLQTEEKKLYSFKRYDYHTYEHFKNDIVDNVYEFDFMGYFQLFKHSKHLRYHNSTNCRECDSIFSRLFDEKILLNSNTKIVKHLGQDNKNHFGRETREDFKM
jgi:hypothetical protein